MAFSLRNDDLSAKADGGGKGRGWVISDARRTFSYLRACLILLIGSSAKGYDHNKSHRRCQKSIELSNTVSGGRSTIQQG